MTRKILKRLKWSLASILEGSEMSPAIRAEVFKIKRPYIGIAISLLVVAI